MSINPTKGIDLVSASQASTQARSLYFTQEQQTLLKHLLEGDRFVNMTKHHLKAALITIQKASEKLEEICEQLHKDLTPSRRQKGVKKGAKKGAKK